MNARRQRLPPPMYTDEEVDEISDRVRYYIRKSFNVVRAIDRALYDFHKSRR